MDARNLEQAAYLIRTISTLKNGQATLPMTKYASFKTNRGTITVTMSVIPVGAYERIAPQLLDDYEAAIITDWFSSLSNESEMPTETALEKLVVSIRRQIAILMMKGEK